MKIRLKELNLKNFKGLDLFALSVNGNPSTAVYGDNATGKTTLFDAWSWLLFGKDSLNSATFEIKPLYPTGEHVHNLEHEVAGIIEADGRPKKFTPRSGRKSAGPRNANSPAIKWIILSMVSRSRKRNSKPGSIPFALRMFSG